MVAGVILKTTRINSNLLQCVKVIAQSRSFTSQLTEQQLEIQELARNFSAEHLKPNAAQLDLKGRFPFNEIKGLTNLGLMGACVDQDYGGLGLDYLSLAVAVEEISRGCASTGMILSIHNFLYANLVNEKGTPEQKERFLNDFTRGSIGCFALSEPNAGSDVANIQTTARKDGDHWILNGKKRWVTSAVEGSAAAVFATFDPELRHKGLACFLVPLDAEGVFRGKKEPLMGVRAATSCDVTLQEVRVGGDQLVGEAGEGFRIAMAQLDRGRVGIAAHAVGIAQAALDTAIDYAKERQAFGKSLTSLPSVQVIRRAMLPLLTGPSDGYVHHGGDSSPADLPRGDRRQHQEQRHGQVRGGARRRRRRRPLRAGAGRPRPLHTLQRRETLQGRQRHSDIRRGDGCTEAPSWTPPAERTQIQQHSIV